MDISICIVSKDRREELDRTLGVLERLFIGEHSEILVFLDGCHDDSFRLIEKYETISWYSSEESIGASPARRRLFKKAAGTIIFGFDDDAHPLNENFIQIAKDLFQQNPTVAVLTFEEIKGIYENDSCALEHHIAQNEFLCNSFVGCGFAILKAAYTKIDGFPEWMDIYGEEGAVSIQLMNKGYGILYTSQISVNHRVNRALRKLEGGNFFRFQKQLYNMGMYFLIFYPRHLLPRKLLKLFWHNLSKYAFTDVNFFLAFFKALFLFLLKASFIINKRSPVSEETINKMNTLPHPKFG